MDLSTTMELSFWKEEPLSPVFSGLEEQADVWQLFDDDVVKQAKSSDQDPLGGLGGDWHPESPEDSCDSFKSPSVSLQARAQLASQLLQDLDDIIIKDEPFASDWYETKTDLPFFEELPTPPPLRDVDDVYTVHRPSFAGLSVPLTPCAATTNVTPTVYAAPAPPAAVLVHLSAVQQQQQHQPAESVQQLHLHHHHQHHPASTGAGTGAAFTNCYEQGLVSTDTQTLLQEFECVFDKVEQSHVGALTPPQSPPHHVTSLPVYSAIPADCHPHLLPPNPHQQLIAEVQQECWPSLNALAPPSPCTSSNSSSYSSDSPAPATPATPASPETDDPEWFPGSPTPPASAEASPARPSKAASRKRGGSRRKPYGSNVEDKRMRKKEQNKNAATRYRMKKKAEVEEILGEENELKEKNDELQAKVTDLSQEIRYLKNLMRDVFRAKGLIK